MENTKKYADNLIDVLKQVGYDPSEKIENGAEFLLKSGLLFEINRRILHPLGLAFCVIKETFGDGRTEYSFAPYLHDNRLEEGGTIYGEEVLYGGELTIQEFMNDFGMGKLQERQKSLGYIVQRSGKPVNTAE
ncbi:hypothetical protein ACP26L_36520 (plasmid) [Paenibacillus sp. S-38]|uniref:hypothetical protein n=1 Tax=Paenibacillus sp. S-38 TaxID=3416710 RepID=UPI003CE7E71D